MLLSPVRTRAVAALSLGALALVACVSDGDSSAVPSAKTVVIGSAPFSGSVIVASMYAGALQNEGYQVTVRKGLGQREIYMPALRKGGAENGIDLVPEYVGTLLEHVNGSAEEASGNLEDTVAKLRARLDAIGMTALEPSPATDQHAFAVTKATADRLRLKWISDLGPHAANMTLGAGPACPTRPLCRPGLEKIYGLKFKTFTPLDAGGVKTMQALASGEIDVGLVFSSGGAIAARNLVVLEDDKNLQAVDNLIPVIHKDVLDDTIRTTLNKVSAEMTTEDLIQLNKRADVDKADPESLAREWLQQHGFVKKN